MDLLQLRYFQALAKNGNLTHTAKLLYVAPPALSVSISRLEKELGAQLFDRIGRRMYLNSRGQQFLDRIDVVLASLDDAVAEIQNMKKQDEKTLYIASTSPNVFQMSFLAFMNTYPQYNLSHTWLKLDQIAQIDLVRKYDFLIASPVDMSLDHELQSQILYDNDYAVLLLPPNHPYTKRAEVPLSEVKDEPFVALSPEYSSRKLFDKMFADAGIVPNIVMECDYTMRFHMVQQAMGLTIATAHTKILGHCGSCSAIRINPPFTTRTQAIYWAPDKGQSSAAKDFFNFMCNYYQNFSFDLK